MNHELAILLLATLLLTLIDPSCTFVVKSSNRRSFYNANFHIFDEKRSSTLNVNNNIPTKYFESSRYSTILKSGRKTSIEDSGVNESSSSRDLYPPPTCFNNGSLPVDSIHSLFYSEYGDTDKPFTALYLHGGPGAGSFPNHARFFDPKYFRVVLFDQRGCGRSTPRGEIRNNTLQHLAQDCETIMNYLNISKWDVVVGGSFGVTLALAYANVFPKSVGSLVLRGLCLMRPREIDWLFGDFGNASRLNPAAWKVFSSFVENDKNILEGDNTTIGRNVLTSYYNRLLGNDPKMRLLATKYWSDWETKTNSITTTLSTHEEGINESSSPLSLNWDGSQWIFQNPDQTSHYMTSTLNGVEVNVTGEVKANSFRRFPSSQIEEILKVLQIYDTTNTSTSVNESQFFSKFNESQISSFIPAQAMLTCYYSYHNSFLNNESLLDKDRIDSIRNIPCIAIQGGLDFICPPDTMLDLHNAWPEMEVRLVLKGGHSVYDPLIKNEVINACDHFKRQLLMDIERI